MFDFLNLKSDAFGLDISDLSFKACKLKERGRFLSLSSWGQVEIKPGLVERGEIKDEDALSEIIKNGLSKIKGRKMKSRNAVISLPESSAFVQVIKMPKMKSEELKTAVPFEAENYIPLPINEVYFDFQEITSANYSKENTEVLISAIPRRIVDSYVSCLAKAGISVSAAEIESQSISRAFIKNEVSPYPVLIIDFGRSRTNFIIFSGHSLQFTSSIPVCSKQLTEAIAKSFNIDFSEAEKTKIKYGLPFNGDNSKKSKSEIEIEGKIYESIFPILSDLAEQAKKHIAYYQSHNITGKPCNIEKVILSGKAANLKNLLEFVSYELKLPAELGNPWVNILPSPLKEVPQLSYRDSLGFATSLGLAVRAIKGE